MCIIFRISLRFDILLQTSRVLGYMIRYKLSNFYYCNFRETTLEYEYMETQG